MKKRSLTSTTTLSSEYERITSTPFSKNVEYVMLNNTNDIIRNSGKDMAISMLINIFKNADTVHLFVNNEVGDVSDDERYELAVQNFLNQKKKVFLVVKKNIEPEMRFRVYKLLYIYAMERPNLVKIAQADIEFLEGVKEIFDGQLNNFCVGNRNFIRIEYDTDNFFAKAGNSIEYGKKLSNIIESCIDRNDILLQLVDAHVESTK